MNTDTTTPEVRSFRLQLFKPISNDNITNLSFNYRRLPRATGCDRRGSGQLYEHRIGRFYLLRLSHKTLAPIDNNFFVMHNNEDLPDLAKRSYSSTTKKPNMNYVLATFLTSVFAYNHQFPKNIVSNYFNRLKTLLKDKLLALRNRLYSDKENNRKTTTYIKFSYKTYVIYLGFYLQCSANCCQPSAYVMSLNRWRCSKHHYVMKHAHGHEHVPKNHSFYEQQLRNQLHRKKKIHNQRLGVSYDCTILRTQNPSNRYKYYKLYKTLKFDIVRSKQQIERWNRITRVSLAPNNKIVDLDNNHQFRTALTNTIPIGNPVIKMIQHVPEKFLPRDPYSIQRKQYKQTAKNLRRRRNRKAKGIPRKKKAKPAKGKCKAVAMTTNISRPFEPQVIIPPLTNDDVTKFNHWANTIASSSQPPVPRTIHHIDLTAQVNPNYFYTIPPSALKFFNDPATFFQKRHNKSRLPTPPPQDQDNISTHSDDSTDTITPSSKRIRTEMVPPPSPN
jgi:hypothetical protein